MKLWTRKPDPVLMPLLLAYHKSLCLVVDEQDQCLRRQVINPDDIRKPLSEFINLLSGTIEELREERTHGRTP